MFSVATIGGIAAGVVIIGIIICLLSCCLCCAVRIKSKSKQVIHTFNLGPALYYTCTQLISSFSCHALQDVPVHI